MSHASIAGERRTTAEMYNEFDERAADLDRIDPAARILATLAGMRRRLLLEM